MVRLGLAIVWLLHFLPLRLLAPLGAGLGQLIYLAGGRRVRIARTNIRLCLTEWPPAAQEQLVRRHFRALGRSLLERGIIWWASPARIQKIIRLKGLEHYQAVAGRPVIWLAPHFVGLDMGGVRMAMTGIPGVSVYIKQKNPYLDQVVLRGRQRFGHNRLMSRQEGIRPAVRALRQGSTFYYLPDMDFGRRHSEFVPFFNIPAATVTGLSRLAHLGDAVVLPVITRQLPGGAGYEVEIFPAWQDFPGADEIQDARRMNAFVETQVLSMPEQYFWVHKRFKTRPPGAPPVYDDAG